ncbi:unnamed protein product [Parajaminaea phylloscopi]
MLSCTIGVAAKLLILLGHEASPQQASIWRQWMFIHASGVVPELRPSLRSGDWPEVTECCPIDVLLRRRLRIEIAANLRHRRVARARPAETSRVGQTSSQI